MDAGSDTVGTNGDTEGDHHGPAGADYPKGFDEASWWPLLFAVGVGGLYLGVGVWLLVGGAAATPVAAGGAGVALAAAVGWVFHGFFVDEPAPTTRDAEVGDVYRRTTWWVTLAEVATVGTVLVAAGYIRATGPPSAVAEPATLPTAVTLANTGLLVASGLTLLWGRRALHAGRSADVHRGLWFTVGLGLLFLVGQAVEVRELLAGGFGPSTSPFAGAFYLATGLHALHVVVGVALVAFLALRARAGWYGDPGRVAETDDHRGNGEKNGGPAEPAGGTGPTGVASLDAAITFWVMLIVLWAATVVVLHG